MMPEDNVYSLWRAQLKLGENGPKKCLTNLMLYLRNLPGLGKALRWNEMASVAEWNGVPLRDEDYVDIRMAIEAAGYQPDKGDMEVAVRRAAMDHPYHPVQDYLDALQWDGKPRLDVWLPHIFGAPDTAYERAVGPKWMIGAVARAYEPGCKMDNMLVLEGPQSLGKSAAIRNLFGEKFFTEMTGDLRDAKRFVEQIMGKWVVEFAEIATIRKSDRELTKAVITTQVDRTMRNYARHATEHPRQCVLAGTINPSEDSGWLSDPTGNRRFWPVRCVKVDMEMLLTRRDQLWAEAVHRYRAGETWWLTAEQERDLAAPEQDERMVVDPWADHLARRLLDDRYTSVEVLRMLGVPVDRQTASDKIRVAGVMKHLGWKQVDTTIEGKSARQWRKQ